MAGRRAILIAGPTASGKSAAALRLAHGLGGVIVNADSMQVYRELRILTARPSAEDVAAAPHRLYGHVSVRQAYSVARWLDDVRVVLDEIEAAGKRSIIVGGTGLYFNALTTGLSPIPPVAADVRAYWRGRSHDQTPRQLHAELARSDPATAALLRPTDPQRIVRALEVLHSTGRPLAEWHQDKGVPLLAPGTWRGLVIAPERSVVRARSDQRFDLMMAGGALEEVRALRQRHLDPALPAMRALGVRPLIAHLDGQIGLEDAVAQAKAETRQYIKRQSTLLRRQMISWRRVKT